MLTSLCKWYQVKRKERVTMFIGTSQKCKPFERFLNEVETWKGNQSHLQTVISPQDSVSNASKGFSKVRRSHSSISVVSKSSVSSACLKAEAEKAALMQPATTLKTKHILEIELKCKMQWNKLNLKQTWLQLMPKGGCCRALMLNM